MQVKLSKHVLLWSMLLTLFLGIGQVASAQGGMLQPVKIAEKISDDGAKKVTVSFTFDVIKGWHLYDQKLESGYIGRPLAFKTDRIKGAKALGGFKADRKPIEDVDEITGAKGWFFEGKVTFSQVLEVTDPENFVYEGYFEWQACQDNCVQDTHDFAFGKKNLSPALIAAVAPSATEEVETDSVETTEADSLAAVAVAPVGAENSDVYWAPVVEELKAFGDKNQEQTNSSLLMIFIYGFVGGLVALVTPCVWPMIPMTVSFFLKRTKSRKAAIRDAVTYGLSIIVIYVALGLIITLAFGPSALNNLATNAIFNIIFFLILVLFAVSFFGAFELVLPSKWTNKMDSKADTTSGLLSLFFMAFTLVLVSFSCTGPIIGTLLVQAVSTGALLGPAVGMIGFAVALALPFSLFAVFPNMLQNMPKSGGWLNSVKVVLGFLELALSLKFLSVADLAYGWGILDRETFLALWIVIFVLLGVYLLGKIQLPHDSKVEKIGVGRMLLALISFSFAIYMVPGLWGAPLKSITAFAPPLYTQDFNLYDGEVHAKFDNYEAGMQYAQANGKPVLLDFSGFGCVNCREMENSVWIDPDVKAMLEDDYVLITLMVDDKTPLAQIEEKINPATGETKKLRTIGDKWSYLQSTKFGSNSQPMYVPIDPVTAKPLSGSRGHDKDISAYKEFLKNGLSEYKELQKK